MPRFIVKHEGSMSSVTDCRLKLCRVRISITGGSCKPEVHSFNTASGPISYQCHSSIFLFCPISSCIFDIISLIQPVSYKGTFLHYSNMQWCKIIPYKKVQSLNVFVFQNNDFVPEPELRSSRSTEPLNITDDTTLKEDRLEVVFFWPTAEEKDPNGIQKNPMKDNSPIFICNCISRKIMPDR